MLIRILNSGVSGNSAVSISITQSAKFLFLSQFSEFSEKCHFCFSNSIREMVIRILNSGVSGNSAVSISITQSEKFLFVSQFSEFPKKMSLLSQ